MTEQVETTEERRTDQINLSPVAADKVKSLLEQEGRDDLALRISVQPGGCSGLRYQLFFDERTLDGDVTTDFDGVTVVVEIALVAGIWALMTWPWERSRQAGAVRASVGE